MSQGQGRSYQPPPPPPPTTQSPWNAGPQGNWPTKYCPSCGASIDARAEICPKCGVRQPTGPLGEVKSRALAIVLALLPLLVFIGTGSIALISLGLVL